ncbi:MAG TPA: alkaline phosphatase family protein [Acetobacteraceae bacterium]|jgi:phospholipase C|nr:alkaline phosphatase family protein [Acetobacteraceae bacterium]
MRTRKRWLGTYVSMLAMMNLVSPAFAAPPLAPNDLETVTPIKHVIVIYGENRSFDHLFATYQARSGDKVWNLLSEGIVNADGSPGPNYAKALQYQASDTTTFNLTPSKTGPYKTLPPPNTDGAPQAASNESPPPFATIAAAEAVDYGVLPRDLYLLTTGATGLPDDSVDTRVANATQLPPGPFELTPGVPYDSYAASPVHRYYQNYQQSDCSASHATPSNPSGCMHDLYPWVEVTIGAGSNGNAQQAGFNDESTDEGATSMGFYNVQRGDMPYFKALADRYTISDNYHQPAMGGTGLDSIMAGFGDAIWYSDGNGRSAVPPSNEIENPNPQTGTNNWYAQDGYSGGSYSACADTTQPGVGEVVGYLRSLPSAVKPNCDSGHYYLLNNYNPGYYGNGTVNTTTFTIPPSPTDSIGNVLLKGQVSFRWYGEGWNQFVANPNDPTNVYCNICDPFLYQSSIMTNSGLRNEVLKDTSDLYTDIQNGILPAVSFVKPGSLNDGHPASSKFSIYEAFVRKILTELRQHPDLWKSTAVFITVDEAGGYYDSGYIQPLDFFGDGPRIPLIVVSPYTRGGHVDHSYSDHISVLKFIEANWRLPTISSRSRDNLPNPTQSVSNPYVPTNSPAIGDLMSAFDFSHGGG